MTSGIAKERLTLTLSTTRRGFDSLHALPIFLGKVSYHTRKSVNYSRLMAQWTVGPKSESDIEFSQSIFRNRRLEEIILQATNPLFILVAIFIAFILSNLLAKFFGTPATDERFATIDGLRGYLAFFVFIHHSALWYFYLHTNKWSQSTSMLYEHLGKTSVALFFMITGFLFFSKIISDRSKPLDWLRLVVSRILRLVPLYFVAISILFIIIFTLSNGKLVEPARVLAKNALAWVIFSFPGTPALNGVTTTWSVLAGVTWSLPYEWFFYACLPLISLLVGRPTPKFYVIASILLIGRMLWMWRPDVEHLYNFVGGAGAAMAVRYPIAQKVAKTHASSFLIIACLALIILLPTVSFNLASFILLSTAFTLIACGNRLFGALTHPASRMLGEMAYGIYLLHGILLFIFFKFLAGPTFGPDASAVVHWAGIFAIIPVLIAVCFLSFVFIERPAMQATPRVVAWLRTNRVSFSKTGQGLGKTP